MNMNFNPYYNPQQTQIPTAQMPNPQNYQMPGYYPPAAPGYYPPQTQPETESGWKKAGKVALDLLKIGVAVCGGVAVYKLAENYFGEDAAPAITATDTSAAAILGGAEDIE